jgi:hypothetical protein
LRMAKWYSSASKAACGRLDGIFLINSRRQKHAISMPKVQGLFQRFPKSTVCRGKYNIWALYIRPYFFRKLHIKRERRNIREKMHVFIARSYYENPHDVTSDTCWPFVSTCFDRSRVRRYHKNLYR